MGDATNTQYLSPEQVRELDDEAFFRAYQEGLVPRRHDHLSEENWEEVGIDGTMKRVIIYVPSLLMMCNCQEIEQIPLFMTRSPTEVDAEASPALAALQQMIHEESDPIGSSMAIMCDKPSPSYSALNQ